ncbi:nitroreductase family protein [Myxococcota bacterium]|nr:nitroreductase family protein [Myxococcota bacterium]
MTTLGAPLRAVPAMNILESIASRTSVRDYATTAVPLEELESLRRFGEEAEARTSDRLTFHLVADGARIQSDVKGILGDYGRMIFAPHYIVLSARESPTYLLESGYRFEQLVLEANRRGFGTCWVGGWFEEAVIRTRMGLPADERIVALTPIGRPAPKKSFLSAFVKVAVRSTTRKPLSALCSWGRAGEPVPADVWANDRARQLLEAARWAPSWANKQPWRFILEPSQILLYKESKIMKETKDYFLVDSGIAMAHIHLAAKELGIEGRWYDETAPVPGAKGPAEPIARYVLPKPLFGN